MTGKTRLTTAPSELTHCSRDDTHTPPTLGLSRLLLWPPYHEGSTPEKKLKLQLRLGTLGEPGPDTLDDSSRRARRRDPETASSVALAVASAGLRIPATSPRPVPGTAPAPQPRPPAHWLG